ncbi:MAG: insulinase family protein [bacterium]|nr:insulinase family protein [bacterium]
MYNRFLYTLLTAILLFGSLSVMAQTESFTLDNGMQVILKENHSSPMVASLVFVKSGSRYEGKFENGITHFLEHLLFDGTTTLSREQLDKSISDLGGYINAFTRKDLTAYLVLLPKQYIDYGMTVQADMLFNSTFPEAELAKERKVVIEEINKDMDSPSAPSDELFSEAAYGATPYGRPVLGYKSFIENIGRDAIIAYWKKYYQPGNMVTLIIGDFDAAQMKQSVVSIFGKATGQAPVFEPSKVERIAGFNRIDTVAAVSSTYINFSIEAPLFGDSTYLPMDLLVQYLNLDEVSPLKQSLLGSNALASEVSASLTSYPDLTRLEISVVSEKAENRDRIVDTVMYALQNLASREADLDVSLLDGIKTSVKTQDIYNAEKLHYYGFMIAPMLMTGGFEFIQQYPELLSKVTPVQMFGAARQWLEKPSCMVTVVRPIDDSSKVPYRSVGMTADEVKGYFATATFPQFDLTKGVSLTYPSTDVVSLKIEDRATYARRTLQNGLTVLVKSAPDSKVFAMMTLGKNRSASEPDSLAGITDFVNRCLEKGTSTRSAAQLSQELNSIGATTTLYDNPWIPYDDRYTTPLFSFCKFETIDEYADKGFALFSDMLQNPSFDSAEVEKVRQGMMGVIGRETGSPGSVAKNLFYKTLLRNTGLDKPVMGNAETLGRITPLQLRDYHARFYAPDNMVLAIATSRDTAEVLEWVVKRFAHLTPAQSTNPPAAQPPALTVSRQEHVELNKEQISIYLGGLLPGINDPSSVSLEVALSILSNRLWSNLRERQGLAYSVGAGAGFEREFGWWYCSIGTSADKYQQAYDGIQLEIDKLKMDGPTELELKQTRNQIWGRLMSAKLSRINQAYYMAVNEFLGRPQQYDPTYLESLTKVDLVSASEAMRKYVRPESSVLVSAGKKAE